MPSKEEKKGNWSGDFGIKYTIRNKTIPENLVPFFKNFFKDIDVNKILEAGCNRGHNLVAISYCGEYDLYGIDINNYSIVLARENRDISFTVGNIFDIPYKDNYFDLVFTAGVLIHINPKDLKKAIGEILRVSNKYFLMMEYQYDFDEFEKVKYRENIGLWRGNYKQFVLNNFNVEIVKEGQTSLDDGFGDERIYFLFKKKNL